MNLQCDVDHPTQTLADLCWLREKFPEGLAGKRIAVSWAYSPSYAKPLSVPQGLVMLLTRFGAHVTLAHPEGYRAHGAVPRVRRGARGVVRRLVPRRSSSMDEAFEGADVVYPKSWGPYDLMLSRVDANRARDSKRMGEIEKEALARNAAAQGLDLRRAADEDDEAAATPSTCTACPPTSAPRSRPASWRSTP